MAIDRVPKVHGATAPAGPESRAAAGMPVAAPRNSPPRAMEKPAPLPQPDASATHPVRPAPIHPSLHDRELAKLREALRGGNRVDAGHQALAVAAGYRMRRSRAARRGATELCTEVAMEVSELADLAEALRTVLLAEGSLHEVSAAATLQACRALVGLLDREPQ